MNNIIYTSYYDNLERLNDFYCISVSRITPEYFHGDCMIELAPSYDLIKKYKTKQIGIIDYKKIYMNEILTKLNVDKIYNKIINKSDKSICLLCYEEPEKFCHRHIIAKWFCDNGYFCKEYYYDPFSKFY